MKKLLSFLLACILVIVVFSGCSRKPEETQTANTEDVKDPVEAAEEKEQSADDSVSITIWTNFMEEAELLQKYADMWSEETGNKAQVIQTGIELQEFAQATKSADGPDGIFGIPNDQLAAFATAGLVAEVPSDFYNDEDYVDAAAQACYIEGKRYGVPIAVETITLFYNTDKVDSPPATWDELLEIAKTSGGIKFDATSIYYDLGFLRAYDGYIFKWEDNMYHVDDIGLGNEGAIQAYTYIKKMVDEGFITADITFDIAKGAFENQETAFYIGGPWDVEAFQSAGVNFAVAEMPTLNNKPFVTPVGTQVGFVSSKSEKKDAVWDFYKFLMEEAAIEMYEVGSRIPASLKMQQQIEVDEITEAFISQIANGEPLPLVPEIQHIWEPYSANMSLMFAGTISPEEAAQYIEEQFKEAIELMHSGR